MSNIDYGLLLIVNEKPVTLGPKEAKGLINNLQAWTLLNPKSYKLLSPIEIGSVSDLDKFISSQFSIEGIAQNIEDALPSELSNVAKKLFELVLTIESFEVNIPAPAKFRKTTDFEKPLDIQDLSKKDQLKTPLAAAVAAVKGGGELNDAANPFLIPLKSNREKDRGSTSYSLGLSLKWNGDPISIIPGSTALQLKGAYLLISS